MQLFKTVKNLLLLHLLGNVVKTDYVRFICQLVWKTSGYGQIPKESVQGAHDLYITRIKQEDGTWVAGHLSSHEDLSYAASANPNNKILISNSYQILTNPNFCVLEWNKNYGQPIFIEHMVKVDNNVVGNSAFYISIAESESQYLPGYFNPSESFTYIVNRNYMKVQSERKNFILTSTHPLLHLQLKLFTYPGLDWAFLQSQMKLDLLSSDETINYQEFRIDRSLNNFFVFPEYYHFNETRNFEGFKNVDIYAKLYFGAPALSFPNQPANKMLLIQRNREIYTNINFTLPLNKILDICVLGIILEDVPVEYAAIGIASSYDPRLRPEHIQNILVDIGHLGPFEIVDDTVKFLISGHIKGKFFIRHRVLSPANSSSGVGCSESVAKLKTINLDSMTKVGE